MLYDGSLDASGELWGDDTLPDTIKQSHFASELKEILEELFDVHHGFFLDEESSFFATLGGIGAEDASTPIGEGTVSIASHVEHTILYIDVLGKHMSGTEVGRVDWDGIWQRDGQVSPEEWTGLQTRLRDKYAWLIRVIDGVEDWLDHDAVGAAMIILAHTASHLGAVRQAHRSIEKRKETNS